MLIERVLLYDEKVLINEKKRKNNRKLFILTLNLFHL